MIIVLTFILGIGMIILTGVVILLTTRLRQTYEMIDELMDDIIDWRIEMVSYIDPNKSLEEYWRGRVDVEPSAAEINMITFKNVNVVLNGKTKELFIDDAASDEMLASYRVVEDED